MKRFFKIGDALTLKRGLLTNFTLVDRDSRCIAFGFVSRKTGFTGFQHEFGVIIQVAVKFGDFPVMHKHEAFGDGGKEVPIVRNEQNRTAERGERHRERLSSLHIEMVGRFVKDNEVGLIPG